MTVLLTPTEDDLRRERVGLLETVHLTEAELRARAEAFLLSADEARVVRRLVQIDYLLGADADMSPDGS